MQYITYMLLICINIYFLQSLLTETVHNIKQSTYFHIFESFEKISKFISQFYKNFLQKLGSNLKCRIVTETMQLVLTQKGFMDWKRKRIYQGIERVRSDSMRYK